MTECLQQNAEGNNKARERWNNKNNETQRALLNGSVGISPMCNELLASSLCYKHINAHGDAASL
jgi:hypothetical protein